MTTEEKVRAYDEALEKAKIEINTKGIGETVNLCEHLFPELRESEDEESNDERIRKSLIKFLTDIKEISESGRTTWAVRKEDAEMCKSFIAWLEKQKENPKSSDSIPADCTSGAKCEDERIRQWLYDLVDEGAYLCERPFATESILAYLEKQKESENTSASTIISSCLNTTSLEEEVERYFYYEFEDGMTNEDIAYHFATWQRQKDLEENLKSADSIPSNCVSDAKCGDRWHNVRDSLPDNAREVLCKDAIGNYFIGRYYSKTGGVWEISMYDDCDKSNEDNPPVVMWIDIPSEKQKEQKPVKCIDFDNEFENQVSHLLASVLNGEHEYTLGFVKYVAQSLLGSAKNEIKPELPLMGGDTDTYFDDLRMTTKSLTSREWFDEGIKYAQRLQKEQKPNIELIQRSWYMEGYHDREFGQEPKWILKTGEDGPKHELNPRYGQPLAEQRPTEEQLHNLNEAIKGLRMDGCERMADSLHSLYNILTKEQKPAEWREEDKKLIDDVINSLCCYQNTLSDYQKEIVGEEIRKLKSLKPQPKQEWGEDDEAILSWCISDIERAKRCASQTKPELCDIEIHWLKSLKPRWKPSDEQMEALKSTIVDVAKFSKRGGRQVELENEPYYSALHSLYCNLEKLM